MTEGRRFRPTEGGWYHFCLGCSRLHVVPEVCEFDGDLTFPSFAHSILVTYNGADAGQRIPGPIDPCYMRVPAKVCHYFLKRGRVEYLPDSTHSLAGQTLLLPALPEGHDQ